MTICTPGEIHMKIQQISSKYISGTPPIHINSIAEEMGISKDILSEHIAILKALDFIDFTDHTKETIILTDSGKYANL